MLEILGITGAFHMVKSHVMSCALSCDCHMICRVKYRVALGVASDLPKELT